MLGGTTWARCFHIHLILHKVWNRGTLVSPFVQRRELRLRIVQRHGPAMVWKTNWALRASVCLALLIPSAQAPKPTTESLFTHKKKRGWKSSDIPQLSPLPWHSHHSLLNQDMYLIRMKRQNPQVHWREVLSFHTHTHPAPHPLPLPD